MAGGGDDARERLLSPQDRRVSREHEEQEEGDDGFTHEELLHSIGSFSAVVPPVAATMLLASFVSLNVEDPATAEALADAYLIYGPDKAAGASTETQFAQAVANALVIVSFFLVATFLIVFCYKFNFNRLLIGYMMLSSAMLLGLLGGNIVIIATAQLDVAVDVVSLLVAMYNFAVVGVIAIFYQKGMPKWVTQLYLVLTSVIMAWQLSQFPEWSTWALVVVLAFYDLCAVLTPCGPLKWLVALVQQEGRPLPGLLYEADIRRHHMLPQPSPVRDNVYYQCESEIPLRLGSPNEAQQQQQQQQTATALTPHEQQLREKLVEFYSKHNPSAIERVDRIVERYRGREPDLWRDLHQKYLVLEEEEDDTIKLGLGDFVFYSVLVSRAAKYDFSAMIACLVSILVGLGGTLFLLGVYKKALPALPISILLATAVYFWLRLVFVDYADTALRIGAISI